MKSKVGKLLLILILSSTLAFLYGADDSLIIRSPYYGKSTTTVESISIKTPFVKQLGIESAPTLNPQERLLEAISNSNYPLTPGDLIELSFTEGSTRETVMLQVDSNYTLNIPTFGTVQGRGKSFQEISNEIVKLVLNYNAYALPSVTLKGTGSFLVTIKGEVNSTLYKSAWGLTRLASLITNATDRSSTRQVEVLSEEGKVATYDLYRALKEGDLTQNPLVKASDIINLKKADKVITISGEVGSPGVYQPMEGEKLGTIIERYAKGVLPSGEKDKILVRRYGNTENSSVDVIRVDKDQIDEFEVKDMDAIYVNQLAPLSRAITIEGAINVGSSITSSSSLNSSSRLYYQFFPGETLFEMLQSIANRFSSVSDLSSTYLLRKGQLIELDVQAILLGESKKEGSLTLLEGDRIVVPFNQLFVNVTGGVMRPGTFPYVPDKKASYYINLAGGFDISKNKKEAHTITDKYGNKLDLDEIIPPEAIITAKLNTFQAVNGINLATTVTIVGLVATILTIVLNIQKL
jgi:polysaccharide export outer membrane protein